MTSMYCTWKLHAAEVNAFDLYWLTSSAPSIMQDFESDLFCYSTSLTLCCLAGPLPQLWVFDTDKACP